MTCPVGDHVDDVSPSVRIGQHRFLLSVGWYRFCPTGVVGKKNVTVYYNNFFAIFQGVMKKKHDDFFWKMTFLFRAYLRKENLRKRIDKDKSL